ncbi:hypothetical protein Tco_0177041, partial [Tanacetum coccineum]
TNGYVYSTLIIGIHDLFHLSNLKKYLADVNLHVPLEEIKIDDKLYVVEEPIEIMDREVKKLKRSWIPIVRVSLELPTRTKIYLGTRRRDEAQIFAVVRERYGLERATEISRRNSL